MAETNEGPSTQPTEKKVDPMGGLARALDTGAELAIGIDTSLFHSKTPREKLTIMAGKNGAETTTDGQK